MSFVFLKNHTTITRYFDTLRQILTGKQTGKWKIFLLTISSSGSFLKTLYNNYILLTFVWADPKSVSVWCKQNVVRRKSSQIKILFFVWFSCSSAFSRSNVVVLYNSRQSSQSWKFPPWNRALYLWMLVAIFFLLLLFFLSDPVKEPLTSNRG